MRYTQERTHCEDSNPLHTVMCLLGSCEDGAIRLLTSTEYDDYTFNDIYGDRMGGRVEVCYNGRYGAVCDDLWTNTDASVACNQLKLSAFGKSI